MPIYAILAIVDHRNMTVIALPNPHLRMTVSEWLVLMSEGSLRFEWMTGVTPVGVMEDAENVVIARMKPLFLD